MNEKNDKNTTHFGFEKVAVDDKQKKVADVFHSVANKYDLMNDLMSLGVHRYWKRIAIEKSAVRPGDNVLDLAGGTGDLAAIFSQRVGRQGFVVLSDINQSMLDIGRDRLTNKGLINNVDFAVCNAEQLPFKNNTFDCVSIAFGLRNVTHKELALAAIQRVLKPGGRMLVLEFSKPTSNNFNRLYDFYSFQILPRIGQLVANDKESYQYLAESIRMHPDQETLKSMILNAGFDQCDYVNLSGGIVALHRGIKY